MSPFRSEKQRKYLWAKHPDIAERWEKEEDRKEKKLKKKSFKKKEKIDD